MHRARWGLWVLIGAYFGILIANRSQVVVRGASMEPTLVAGERVLTVPVCRRALRAGQVVVVTNPQAPDRHVIKRLTAHDQDSVEVRGDAPYRSTDSRTWGRLPITAVRRIVVARWPDVRTSLAAPSGGVAPATSTSTSAADGAAATSTPASDPG